MILSIIFSIISIAIATVLSIVTYQYSPWFIALFIVLLPIFYLLCFGIYVIFMFFATLVISKKKEIKKPSKFAYFLIKQTAYVVLMLANVKIHFNDNGLLKKNTRYLVVSNHMSNFDPIVMIAIFKSRLICVTKPENYNIPIVGKVIHKAGFIRMFRDSAYKAVAAINKAVEYLNKDYGDILIYPEGKRSFDAVLLPFHPGSFKICTKAEVPLVICSIKNANLVKKYYPFKRTHIYVDVLKIIEPKEFENMNTVELADMTKNVIAENLEK